MGFVVYWFDHYYIYTVNSVCKIWSEVTRYNYTGVEGTWPASEATILTANKRYWLGSVLDTGAVGSFHVEPTLNYNPLKRLNTLNSFTENSEVLRRGLTSNLPIIISPNTLQKELLWRVDWRELKLEREVWRSFGDISLGFSPWLCKQKHLWLQI